MSAQSVLDERRRVIINQKADYDFVDLCAALAECAEASQALDDDKTPFITRAARYCDVCGNTTPMARFCMPCAAIAARVIAQTADTIRLTHGMEFFIVARGFAR